MKVNGIEKLKDLKYLIFKNLTKLWLILPTNVFQN